MSWTQAQIDALKDAYARGVTSVSHNGKTVTYASLESMLRAIRQMELEVNPQTTTNRPNTRKIRFGEVS